MYCMLFVCFITTSRHVIFLGTMSRGILSSTSSHQSIFVEGVYRFHRWLLSHFELVRGIHLGSSSLPPQPNDCEVSRRSEAFPRSSPKSRDSENDFGEIGLILKRKNAVLRSMLSKAIHRYVGWLTRKSLMTFVVDVTPSRSCSSSDPSKRNTPISNS